MEGYAEPTAGDVYDAIVIGGGPGGSTVASFLARAGKRVLVLEKERFPRFHIGESLLPYNHGIFADLGVLPKLEHVSKIRKWGAQFHIGNGSKALKLVFRNGRFTREPMAFQVERAPFDKMLLDHARELGAEVREECSVTSYSVQSDHVAVVAESGGKRFSFTGRFLADASGRSNFTGNIERLREVHPHLKKLAVFGHFRGVKLDEGEARGDTVIVRLGNKWFWIIPIDAEKTSVGCVMDAEEFSCAKKPAAAQFEEAVQSAPVVRERMANASLTGQIHTTSDFSYKNRRFAGPRLLRIGDAAGFMDPIFSAGVYLAMFSGKLAAEMIGRSLSAGDDGSRRFQAYERRVLDAMKGYWRLVEGYYTKPFMELFMEPRPKFNLPSALTALLAGEVEGDWRIKWRLQVFYWLAALQKHVPLVPRLEFKDDAVCAQSQVMEAVPDSKAIPNVK